MSLAKHTVKSYDDEFKSIAADVSEMLRLTINSIRFISQALDSGDNKLYDEVRNNDQLINDLDRNIESRIAQIIALRQPMAVDLRYLVSAIKVAVNVERAGDQAKNIVGKIVKLRDSDINSQFVALINEMVEISKDMLQNAVESYNNQDLSQANRVLELDEKINADYKQFKKIIGDDNFDRDQVLDFIDVLFVAKSLERIGDYAKNIAEISQYVIGK